MNRPCVLAAAAAGVTLCWSTAPARAETGAELARALEGSRPVFREGTTITGVVDLRGLRTVSVPFVCRGCSIAQGIVAPHVRFERTIDLGRSTIGSINVEGARFGEALLLGGASVDDANFSFATFEDLSDFAGASFGPARFSSARFDALARFSGAEFAEARFVAARFGREALFSRAFFGENATFDGAVFGHLTDFRSAQFFGPARFPNTDFSGRVDFSRAEMKKTVDFSAARFADDASFVGTVFDAKPHPSVSFEGASIGGRLDFTAAFLHGRSQFLKLSAGTLVFSDATFAKTTRLDMNDVTAGELELALDDVDLISTPQDQERALARIESTAKSAGEIALANDARYRLQELASRDDWQPRKLADFLFYRWVAGYLVRPLRPLLWLLGLVLLFSLIRTIVVEAKSGRWQQSRFAQTSGRFVRQLAYTVTPRGGGPDTPAHRRVELAVYAVLLTCFLIGLANSNPTLREMVDAVI